MNEHSFGGIATHIVAIVERDHCVVNRRARTIGLMNKNDPFNLSAFVLNGVLGLTILTAAGCSTLKTHRTSVDDGNVEAAVAPRPAPVFPVANLTSLAPPLGKTAATSGVVFAWTVSGSTGLISDAGCRLRVRHRESGDTVLLKIDPKTPISIQNLKPGTWDAKRLGCGITRVWDLEGLFRDGFVVKPNSVSVIGWFIFEFDEKGLTTVREGGRKENSNLALQLRSEWSSSASLISGFSGKSIPLKFESQDEIVRVKAQGLKNSESLLEPLLKRFQSCASEGMKVDPLRAGTLKIEASYKAGVFQGVKTGLQDNALRDDLIQCIVQAHETFKLSGSGDFTLNTIY